MPANPPSGRFELCQMAGETIALFAVRRSNLALFEALRGDLLEKWFALQFNTSLLIDRHSVQIRAIAQLVPSYPSIPASALNDPATVEPVFLTRWNAQREVLPAIAVALNIYEPLGAEKRERDPDEPITIDHVPFPSSSDADCDALASLMAGLEVGNALAIWEQFSAEQINKILFTVAELRRDPGERVEEYLAHLFFKGREEQSEEYQRSLVEDGWN